MTLVHILYIAYLVVGVFAAGDVYRRCAEQECRAATGSSRFALACVMFFIWPVIAVALAFGLGKENQ